jgi:predicted metal-dependent phosphoesterase TrpH
MHLKGALHVHTTCSDGELGLEETLRVYESLGFDFIALTDHDHLLRTGCYDALWRIKTELIVFTGVEMTVFERGYCHVNRVAGDRETLFIFNHPAQLDLPMDKAVARVLSVAEKFPLDGVEITSNGFKTPEYDRPDLPFPKVATDDAHNLAMCGRAWVEMDAPRNRDAIIRAVRNGDFWNCYRD